MPESFAQPRLVLGTHHVDLERMIVERDGHVESLTPMEVRLLVRLAREPGMEVSRDQLLVDVWEYSTGVMTRTVDATVRRLRKKIEVDPNSPVHLLTVRGVGYRLVVGAESTAGSHSSPVSRMPSGDALPTWQRPLIGRARDLVALESAFGGGERWVMVSGAPGTGKTRLAAEFASRWATLHGRAVWFCDLGDVDSMASMIRAIAGAINLPILEQMVEGEALERLGKALCCRGSGLLFLDSVERVSEIAIEPVRQWLGQAPGLQILMTSRRRMREGVDRYLDVEPLEVQEGVALLRDGMRAVCGQDENWPSELLIDIVERLDGLPLAIELAAARVGVLGVAGLRDRLAQQLDLLKRSGRALPERQTTLRAAIAWSWALLSEPERHVLMRCAFFRGGFTVDGVTGVMTLEEPVSFEVLDVLEALRDHSLIRVSTTHDGTGVGRLTLLSTVAAFCREMLVDSGAELPVALAHMTHFVRWGEEVLAASMHRKGVRLRSVLNGELDNLLLALETARLHDKSLAVRLALVLDGALSARGPYDQLLTLLGQAIEDSAETSVALRAQVLLARALAWQSCGRMDTALSVLDTVEALPAGDEHASWRGRSMEIRGGILRRLGQLESAETTILLALSHYRKEQDQGGEASALAALGATLTMLGRLPEGQAHLERALRLGEHDWRVEARARVDLGLVARQRGHLQEARAELEQAIDLMRSAGDRRDVARVLGNLGIVTLEQGELDTSERVFGEALQITRDVLDRRAEGQVLGRLAIVYRRRGAFFEAEACLRQALAAHRDVRDRRSEGAAESNLGLLCVDRGRLDEAMEHLNRALKIHQEVDDQRSEAVARINLGSVRLEEGSLEEARPALARALEVAQGVEDPVLEGLACQGLALADHLGGSLDEAGRWYERAWALLQSTDQAVPCAVFYGLWWGACGKWEAGSDLLNSVASRVEHRSTPLTAALLNVGAVALSSGLARTGLLRDPGQPNSAPSPALSAIEDAARYSQDVRFAQRLAIQKPSE